MSRSSAASAEDSYSTSGAGDETTDMELDESIAEGDATGAETEVVQDSEVINHDAADTASEDESVEGSEGEDESEDAEEREVSPPMAPVRPRNSKNVTARRPAAAAARAPTIEVAPPRRLASKSVQPKPAIADPSTSGKAESSKAGPSKRKPTGARRTGKITVPKPIEPSLNESSMLEDSGTGTASAAGTSTSSSRSKKSDKKKKNHVPKVKTPFAMYIFKVHKQIQADVMISVRAMVILESFVQDMFERFAREASILATRNGRRTLGSREVESAVRLILGYGPLGNHAISEGAKALAKYSRSRELNEAAKKASK